MEEYANFIKRHIADKRGLDTDTIDVEANLFEHHYTDSLGVFTLLLEIENAFGVRFDEGDISSGSMRTIRGICEVIAAKQAA